ncbi:MAG: hypothetical protein EB120_08095, partial [Proteobacteria bacterium]|nr:hypothetical protein [Pseudomonadota bacterium]
MGAYLKLRNSRGQVAILFALVFTFMFVLFAFVVDFGHLIHNKMNLQIAADSAAYAGAAWQARLLNQMGIVNYHLRQDHKELTMRINVTHARFNRTFPRGRTYIDGPHGLSAGSATMVCQQAYSYLSLRGRRYASDTNLCRNADPATGGLPPIVVPPAIATFDPAVIAIRAQIRSIEGEAAKECLQGKDDNSFLIQHLVEMFKQRSDHHLGEIAAIRDLMNQVSQENNTSSSQHPIVQAAYQSALRNLTESNRNGEFEMSILQPQDGIYVDTETIKANTNLWYFKFQNLDGGGCIANPEPFPFNPTLGVQKVPQYLTYFGVKVTSKPQMLFMPQS